MFVAREIKQTLLRKFSEIFFDSPFILSFFRYISIIYQAYLEHL